MSSHHRLEISSTLAKISHYVSRRTIAVVTICHCDMAKPGFGQQIIYIQQLLFVTANPNSINIYLSCDLSGGKFIRHCNTIIGTFS